MRLSTVQIFQQGINSILSQQAQLQKTQQQLASGLRVATPADDPIAAVQIMDISEDLELLDQYQRNANLAAGQLALTDNALQDATDVLQRVRELVVQANNATQTPETRGAIAVELEARLEELVSLANSRDANGEYLFAGFQSQTRPFSRGAGQVLYNGDDGQRFLQLAAGSQVAVRDSGQAVFMEIPVGNGSFDVRATAGNSGSAVLQASSADSSFLRDSYSITFSQPNPGDPVSFEVTDSSAAVVASGPYQAGAAISFNGASVTLEGSPADGDSFLIPATPRQDVFTTLQNLVDSLQNAGTGPAAEASVNNALASGLGNLDQAIGRMLEQQVETGVRLNRVDSQRASNEAFTLQLQETLSEVRDLDVAEAISRLNLQLVALQAAQQSYVRIQGLSLFNFL